MERHAYCTVELGFDGLSALEVRDKHLNYGPGPRCWCWCLCLCLIYLIRLKLWNSRCELWHAGALSIRLGWFDVELYPTWGLT